MDSFQLAWPRAAFIKLLGLLSYLNHSPTHPSKNIGCFHKPRSCVCGPGRKGKGPLYRNCSSMQPVFSPFYSWTSRVNSASLSPYFFVLRWKSVLFLCEATKLKVWRSKFRPRTRLYYRESLGEFYFRSYYAVDSGSTLRSFPAFSWEGRTCTWSIICDYRRRDVLWSTKSFWKRLVVNDSWNTKLYRRTCRRKPKKNFWSWWVNSLFIVMGSWKMWTITDLMCHVCN